MRLFDLLVISICKWIDASNIPFQSSSHRYLQDPDTAQPVFESTPTTVPLSIPTSSPNVLSTKSTDTQVPSITFSDVPSARPTMSLKLLPTSESLTSAPSVAFSDSPSTIPTNAAIAPTSNPTNSPSNTYPSPSPTASPTTTCDEDENWTDRFGDGCDWYRINDPECTFATCCGNVNTGLTSGDVCCHCQDIDPAPTPLLFQTGIPTITPTVSFTPTYLPFFPATKQSVDPTYVINSNNNDKNKSSSDDIEDSLSDYHIGAVVIGVGVIIIVYVIAIGKLGGLKEDKDNGEDGTSQSCDKFEMD